MSRSYKIKNRVLVVDDNAKNIQVLANHLKEDNYEVEYASSGKNAILMVEKEEFDLILLDVMMPGIDGFETCRRIKNIEHRKHIPIVFVTAKTDIDSLTLGFQYGGVDYITKPFKADELLLRVSTHVELKKARDLLNYHKTYLEKKEETFTNELKNKQVEFKKHKDNLKSLIKSQSQLIKILTDVYNQSLNNLSTPVSLLKLKISDQEPTVLINEIENLIKSNSSTAEFILKNQAVFINQEAALSKIKFAPERLIANILSEKASQLRSKAIQLTSHSDKNIEILGDADLIESILKSIIENAMQYSPENSTIEISLVESENDYTLTVSDQGKGFSKHYILYPFQAFQDDDKSYHLNLFFAKYVLDLHHFELKIGNNTDSGAFVKIIFPK
ncbi:MAG: hybrid sensor histidine kinase/response regulator [Bacteroidales bacterium]|nr:hybrid sensor histidine kinase/response regulator [Bacteroidales bacterium]